MVPFFSVVVPLHNAADRMRKGLDSIKQQTFKDYELILVCDDCQDNTAEIAREYTDKVFEVQWHNCGKTRNKGLDKATGKWVLFMDDDDWWMSNTAFKEIADAIVKNGKDFDVLVFDFIFGNNGWQTHQNPDQIYIAIWNKAWKREFIGEHRFPPMPHSDDAGFAEEMHPLARFRFHNKPYYYYNFMRPGSISYLLDKGELKHLEDMTPEEKGVIN